MDTSLVFASALVAFSLASIALILTSGRKTSDRALSRRESDYRAVELAPSLGARAGRPMLRWLARRARRITPVGVVDGLESKLTRAGMAERFPLERVLALKFGVFGLGVLGAIWLWLNEYRLGALAAVVAGYFIVDLWIGSRATERAKAITREIPDIIDQLTISVESGLAFEGALSRISQHEGELPAEFSRTLSEIQLGVPRSEALRNMVERTGVQDLRWFVASMVHAESFGIPIGKVLRTQSVEFREKRKMRAQERAQRLPVLVIFPLVLFIFPALFVVLLAPAVIKIFEAFASTG
jgi:tight adherence protein C